MPNNSPETMQEGLSVLIPVYNHGCAGTVSKLLALCDSVPRLRYEIIVADDGSTDSGALKANGAIAGMPNCRFYALGKNSGSAATRNFLAEQSQYRWLLFLDCDIGFPGSDFIATYLDNRTEGCVTSGGVITCGATKKLRRNLRFVYEHNAETAHSAAERSKKPYQSFRSVSFMIPRDVFLECRFDERFRRFEDVYFGKELQRRGIGIRHIDNPVVISDFESNEKYLNKIELDLRVLYNFREELAGFSRMLDSTGALRRAVPLRVIKVWHRLFGRTERRLLTVCRPNLCLFNIYRIGYFMSNYK